MLLSLVTWTSAFTAGATKPQTGKRELSSDQETDYVPRELCERAYPCKREYGRGIFRRAFPGPERNRVVQY
ncbi:hypothetical protein ABFA07_006649 [Porites harrisoni]